MKDYYRILEVNERATQQQIKEAYRRLAFKYHPDRNRDNPSAVEKMKEINEAYSVLSDPEKRKQYDALRAQYGSSGYERFRQRYSDEDIFRGSDINRIFDEFAKAFGFRSADDIFRDIYGSRYRRFEFESPGFFARGFFIFTIPYREKPHKSPRREKNQAELGVSRLSGLLKKAIEYTKKITDVANSSDETDLHDVVYLTPEQAHAGGELIYQHRGTDGKLKEIAIKIPPGIRDGQVLRLKGLGRRKSDGSRVGDLYLKVKVQVPLYSRLKHYVDKLVIQGREILWKK
ncbi:Chaperone protein DnaJ [bacterium HR37]|nr:Chaperone protein DnaJ [bacterium HR37]